MVEQTRTKASSVSLAYKKIVTIFILVAIVLLAVILYFSLAKAEIFLKVKSQPAKIDFTTQVKENVEEDSYLETNVLEGRVLELTLEKTKEFKVEEKKKFSEKYGGVMTVVNNKNVDQTLVKRTQFQSESGKIFRAQERVTIPAKSKKDVYVLADELGEDYNVLPGKFTIIKLRVETQKYIYGEAQEAMSQQAVIVNELTESDLETAKLELIEDLKADAIFKLRELLLTGEELKDSSIMTEVMDDSIDESLGEVVDSFQYTMKLKVVGVIFNEDELLTLAQTFLNEQLDASQKLLNYDNSSFVYSVGSYVPEEKSISLEVSLSANVAQNSNSEIFNPDRFKSLTQEEIIDYFKTIPAIESVRVKFSPFWVNKAPKMADHIKMIINE